MGRQLGPGSQGHCRLLGPQPGCALMATRRHEALSSFHLFVTGRASLLNLTSSEE